MRLHSVNYIIWEDLVLKKEESLKDLAHLTKFDRSYFQPDKVLLISTVNKNDPELQTDEQYFYLLLRWRLYARNLLICFFILLGIGALLSFKRSWYQRYPPNSKLKLQILNILQPILIFLTLICFLGYLFFDPWINIGGDLNQWISRSSFFILLGLGIGFGMYITPYLRSQNLVRKNMP